MNSLTRTFAVAGLSASLLASCLAAGDGWLTSYPEAVKLAKKTGKPIMANFTGSDWCTCCKKLDKEVFDTPTFKKWAAKNVILLELDYPHSTPQPKDLAKQNEALGKKYHANVPGFPTILFIRPDGSVFGRYGYDQGGADHWTQMAARLLPLQKQS
jgi:thioredoxin-related protein